MVEAIFDALGPVMTRWTMGGGAVALAPEAWREALGTDPNEAELRLLALSGQLLGAMVVVEPAGEVKPLADIPVLALPPLPDSLRAYTRRLLQRLPQFQVARRAFLDFFDRRGWTLHPADWLPRPDEDAPETYAAWQDWAAGARTQPGTPPGTSPEILTAEHWDDLGAAARHAAFVALRRRDPAAASALLMEKIAGESADHRLRLVKALATNLSDIDQPLLDMLKKDRAPRVRTWVVSLLARLGHDEGQDGGDDAAELADFFTLRPEDRRIIPRALKTSAQQNRRQALLEAMTFGGFARVLGLTAEELAAAWLWGDDSHVDCMLAGVVASSASDDIVALVAEALTGGSFFDHYSLTPLLPRLTQAQRRQILHHLLRKSASFIMALAIAGNDGEMDGVIDTVTGGNLLDIVQVEHANPTHQMPELVALGLLISRQEAQHALDRLTAAGMMMVDPRLDMLRLNIALENRRAETGT